MPNPDRSTGYLHKLIKGRIAETIVEELFRALGFRVFRYGMESTVPGIIPLIENGDQNPVSIRLRRMPDLVVYKDRQAFFVEVKYVASGQFSLRDIPDGADYPYQNALFVVVSKKHIKCISYEQLCAGEQITPHTLEHLLGDRQEFATDKTVIRAYCEVVEEVFAEVG